MHIISRYQKNLRQTRVCPKRRITLHRARGKKDNQSKRRENQSPEVEQNHLKSAGVENEQNIITAFVVAWVWRKPPARGVVMLPLPAHDQALSHGPCGVAR